MFRSLLIANRGEIARRILRTAKALGVRTIAVYSDADQGALHVREADQAVRLGPPPARDSYLNIEAVIAAASSAGADAIHPGYGFLSENAEFAAACANAGLTFIGPPVDAIRRMGSKIEAKAIMAAAGVPVVPGVSGVGPGQRHRGRGPRARAAAPHKGIRRRGWKGDADRSRARRAHRGAGRRAP